MLFNSLVSLAVVATLGERRFTVLFGNKDIHLAATIRAVEQTRQWVVIALLIGAFALHALANPLNGFKGFAVGKSVE